MIGEEKFSEIFSVTNVLCRFLIPLHQNICCIAATPPQIVESPMLILFTKIVQKKSRNRVEIGLKTAFLLYDMPVIQQKEVTSVTSFALPLGLEPRTP